MLALEEPKAEYHSEALFREACEVKVAVHERIYDGEETFSCFLFHNIIVLNVISLLCLCGSPGYKPGLAPGPYLRRIRYVYQRVR